MNPINAINQEFTRVVVQEWSEQENGRAPVQSEQRAGVRRSVQTAIAWVLMHMQRPSDTSTAHPQQMGASQ